MKFTSLFLIFFCFLLACQGKKSTVENLNAFPVKENPKPPKDFTAFKTEQAPIINGIADDTAWKNAEWYPMQERWLGETYTSEDFQGRYKLTWDEKHIYILAEIVDDTLIDIHEDGLKNYWDDDCLEIFIDEDHSGGNHQYSHNAFAYHIALDNRVVDVDSDKVFRYYTDHLLSRRVTIGKTSIWESAMTLYSDQYQDDASNNSPVKLSAEKQVGFAIAYCDNDYSSERENFIGSLVVEGEDKNRGWIDAGIFGNLTLKE